MLRGIRGNTWGPQNHRSGMTNEVPHNTEGGRLLKHPARRSTTPPPSAPNPPPYSRWAQVLSTPSWALPLQGCASVCANI